MDDDFKLGAFAAVVVIGLGWLLLTIGGMLGRADASSGTGSVDRLRAIEASSYCRLYAEANSDTSSGGSVSLRRFHYEVCYPERLAQSTESVIAGEKPAALSW